MISRPVIPVRILCASTILSFAILAACLAFAVPAGAVENTGWDFDFNVQPAVIEVGQMVNVSVHTYYFGNDSQHKPFQADAPGVTVTINSEYFNTIERANNQGWMINADHPDVPGNYTYTAKVIFDTETKTKTVMLVVHPAVVPTIVPVSGSPSPVVATPLPADDENITGFDPDQVRISNLDQPLLQGSTNNGTGAPTDNPYVVIPASASSTATPSPTKTPSVLMSITGTVCILIIVCLLARRKQ